MVPRRWRPRARPRAGAPLLGAALVVAASGCDLVFGIDASIDTPGSIDGPPGDGRRPGICPAIGAGPPMFRPALEEVISRACHEYTQSEPAGLAVADCGEAIEEGPVGGPLSPATIIPSLGGATIREPALAPEGDGLVGRELAPGLPSRVSWFVPSGSTWTHAATLAESATFHTAGTPSATPDRRLLVASLAGLSERAEEQGWAEVRFTTWQDLGLLSGIGDQPNLSPDGLRLTFLVAMNVYYADRSSTDVPFSQVAPVPSVGQASSAFLTSDCGRIYFSGLGKVFARDQQR